MGIVFINIQHIQLIEAAWFFFLLYLGQWLPFFLRQWLANS